MTNITRKMTDLELETGWTPEAALAMAIECRSDDRLFGSRSNGFHPLVIAAADSESFFERFERETGWTYGDALEEALDQRRDRRLHRYVH